MYNFCFDSINKHIPFLNTPFLKFIQHDIRAIENVQRRATKQIPSIREQSYEQRLGYLDLPTLRYRRQRGDMIETYKILTNKYDQLAHDIFPLQEMK